MTVTAHRARRHRPARTGRVRAALAVVALSVALPLGACANNEQTTKPYTPAEGVNLDVGNFNDPQSVVHVRNLLIISRAPGDGILSASMVTLGQDSLTSVTGVPYKADGSKGTPFTAQLGSPLQLADNNQIVLTNNQPFITISGASGLQAGLDAEVTLTFAKAGTVSTRTTVVDGKLPPYTEISPSASPSATPSVTAAPSPTP